MNLKWYFSTLIVTVAFFFGVASQQQHVVPNQEIVLQFSGDVFAQDKAEQAILAVKHKLQAIGADNIQVVQNEEGVLKITYYSDADIDHIKTALAEDQSLEFENSASKHRSNSTEFPSQDQEITYNFDVYEIHNGNDFAFEHAGKVAVELKASSHHFSNTNDHLYVNHTTDNIEFPSIKVAYKFYTTIALAIENNSKQIPEVRAGPLA
ncbi:hypothetical protein [Formosa haliotis]|uniref:hypothetical protein n=1 Tax=Formosa haliotis TaxID=1555194 RepID=UPI0008253027|nr:hypothetical protein [Formosa haliotis]